ncbi:MAG: acetyl xylan esterase [Chitinophagaceae bacterium]|nr:acetyl xylan esterase [Chitinophagaceae bacterium]
MKSLYICLLLLNSIHSFARKDDDSTFYRADHSRIQYTGRIDFSNPVKPRFWAPGSYITIRFSGTYCVMEITDEEKWGKSHNYLQVIVNDQPAYRIQTKGRKNKVVLASGLPKGEHTIIICKNTEAEIGYLELIGFTCNKLLSPPKKPKRKMEFIGNSITCGMGNDDSEIPCKTKEWYDQYNAYLAYGPLSARALNAQWHLSSVSGIGLIQSCCNKTTAMPQVFDKINMAENNLTWNFKRYQPDVVTICLGQNDGIQDSAAFCAAYIQFVNRLRNYYPKATIILLTSPMADQPLDSALKKYINVVTTAIKASGEKKIESYFFSRRYNNGCDAHPNAGEHAAMAKELTAYTRQLMQW